MALEVSSLTLDVLGGGFTAVQCDQTFQVDPVPLPETRKEP